MTRAGGAGGVAGGAGGVAGGAGGAAGGAGAEALARIRDNAFYVLELPAACSRHDMERQGQKLLAMLELGLSAAMTYATPLGVAMRDADKVRRAMATLRDPEKRLEEELWARIDPAARAEGSGARDEDEDLGLGELRRAPRPDRPWAGALTAFGWGRR
ncbi:MAG: hypothetical protein R3B70_20765 [Polyangiaceae bacterium]